MNDARLIRWIEEHLAELRRLVPGSCDVDTFEMHYIDANGETRVVEGVDLRDCIRTAVVVMNPPRQKDERRAAGGRARAISLTPKRRREIAITAANKRWGRP